MRKKIRKQIYGEIQKILLEYDKTQNDSKKKTDKFMKELVNGDLLKNIKGKNIVVLAPINESVEQFIDRGFADKSKKIYRTATGGIFKNIIQNVVGSGGFGTNVYEFNHFNSFYKVNDNYFPVYFNNGELKAIGYFRKPIQTEYDNYDDKAAYHYNTVFYSYLIKFVDVGINLDVIVTEKILHTWDTEDQTASFLSELYQSTSDIIQTNLKIMNNQLKWKEPNTEISPIEFYDIFKDQNITLPRFPTNVVEWRKEQFKDAKKEYQASKSEYKNLSKQFTIASATKSVMPKTRLRGFLSKIKSKIINLKQRPDLIIGEITIGKQVDVTGQISIDNVCKYVCKLDPVTGKKSCKYVCEQVHKIQMLCDDEGCKLQVCTGSNCSTVPLQICTKDENTGVVTCMIPGQMFSDSKNRKIVEQFLRKNDESMLSHFMNVNTLAGQQCKMYPDGTVVCCSGSDGAEPCNSYNDFSKFVSKFPIE